jgi:hypothetical protein
MYSAASVDSFAEHSGMVSAVAWGSSEELLVSGGADGRLRWWDVQRGECVRVRDAHQGTVQSLRRSPDGTKLASCGDDGANLHSGAYLQTLRRDRPYERMDISGLTGISAARLADCLRRGGWEGRQAPCGWRHLSILVTSRDDCAYLPACCGDATGD